MPLRASSFHRHELPVIILVTDLDYIKNEWDMICTFPDIFILNVRTVVRAVHISVRSFFRARPAIRTIFN